MREEMGGLQMSIRLSNCLGNRACVVLSVFMWRCSCSLDIMTLSRTSSLLFTLCTCERLADGHASLAIPEQYLSVLRLADQIHNRGKGFRR